MEEEKEVEKLQQQIKVEKKKIQPSIEQLEIERGYLTESEDQANKLYDEIRVYQETYNTLGILNLKQKIKLRNIISKKTIKFNVIKEKAQDDRKIYNNYIDEQINNLRTNLISLEKELENKKQKRFEVKMTIEIRSLGL